MKKLLLILSTVLFVIMTTNVKAEQTYSTAVIGYILTELLNGNGFNGEVGNQEVARVKHNGTIYFIDKIFSDGKGGLLYNHPFIASILEGVHLQVQEQAHREWVKDVMGNDVYEALDPLEGYN